MKAIIPVIWPGKDAEVLSTLESQANNESPGAYEAQKKLLAILADIVSLQAGVPV